MGSRILLLLILTSSVWGQDEMSPTQSLYEAVENQTITLEWTFTIRRPLRHYEVYCQHITGPMTSVVLHVEQGVQYPDSQDPDFAGRVQFDEEVFREGRLRVHVSRLQTTDSGLYQVEVVTEYGSNFGTCRLSVSAAAKETEILRPGPVGPGPERPGPERPGPKKPGPEGPGTEGLGRTIVGAGLVLGLIVLVFTAVIVGIKYVIKLIINFIKNKQNNNTVVI
ncbi:uncharacterized protein V6R79_002152 [Siganus canaliculatus]